MRGRRTQGQQLQVGKAHREEAAEEGHAGPGIGAGRAGEAEAQPQNPGAAPQAGGAEKVLVFAGSSHIPRVPSNPGWGAQWDILWTLLTMLWKQTSRLGSSLSSCPFSPLC